MDNRDIVSSLDFAPAVTPMTDDSRTQAIYPLVELPTHSTSRDSL